MKAVQINALYRISGIPNWLIVENLNEWNIDFLFYFSLSVKNNKLKSVQTKLNALKGPQVQIQRKNYSTWSW